MGGDLGAEAAETGEGALEIELERRIDEWDEARPNPSAYSVYSVDSK